MAGITVVEVEIPGLQGPRGAEDAAGISFVPAGTIAATNVQDAIAELDSEKQPLDADLTAVAGLSPSNDDVLQRKAGAWANRTIAQLTTDLALHASNIPSTASGDVAATNVDAAIAELASEKAPKATPIFTGLCTLPAVLSGGPTTIADDAVANFGAIALSVRLMLVMLSGGDGSVAFYRIGGGIGVALSIGTPTAAVVTSTSDVTGTTGADGKITIAYVSGTMKIENRVGSSITVSYVLLGGGAL